MDSRCKRSYKWVRQDHPATAEAQSDEPTQTKLQTQSKYNNLSKDGAVASLLSVKSVEDVLPQLQMIASSGNRETLTSLYRATNFIQDAIRQVGPPACFLSTRLGHLSTAW
jgi:hypothetical protein